MSQQNPQDWEQRLKDLEAEINQESELSPVRPFKANENPKNILVRFKQWYDSLAIPTKVGLTIVAIIVALSLLNSILRLVTSVIMLGILGSILFALYKALFNNKSS
ncbi:hypothetical protein RGRSB_0669 [cyanobacterium endosymbiont of Rhopalodia gibberula]|uniref:hypothetical protein n=1 Tax=cyanobacterium endosymbiont of Rhopalodia gibberula TaxID=1763363 RepID=UPI000DC6F90E|nr:hypothetical protein [cyanobacterium endosymbiont of Rhopalodia gibberula]BBA79219.1 hypothetical protein RGRSB_0669 [cyanobacterium endosymbiont of Rhopalodia gibberula]